MKDNISKKSLKRLIAILVAIAVASGMLCVFPSAAAKEDNVPYFNGIDTMENLDKTCGYSNGISITDWFGGAATAPWDTDTFEKGVAIYPYIKYKVETGSVVRFDAYQQNDYKDNRFKMFESDDGTKWSEVILFDKSNLMTDTAWTQVTYISQVTTKPYVKITFPDLKLNGTAYLLDNVQTISGSLENFRGLDDYTSSDTKISTNISLSSGNLIKDNIAWNEGLNDSVYPKTGSQFYEAGKQSTAYISYKIDLLSHAKFTVYQYDGNGYDYNWKIQTSDNGYEWKDEAFETKSLGALKKLDGTQRDGWNVYDFTVRNVNAEFIRIIFPYADWINTVHSVAVVQKEIQPDDTAVLFNGTDSFDNLSQCFAYSYNVKTKDNLLQNDESISYIDSIDDTSRKSGWVMYKISGGSGVSFGVQYKNDPAEPGLEQYKLYSSDDMVTWNEISISQSDFSYDGYYWNKAVFTAGIVNAQYIKICLPDGYYGWEAMLSSVTVATDTGYSVNFDANNFRGTDHCGSYDNIVAKSSNVFIDKETFICPNEDMTYIEDLKRDAGFVAYKIAPGDDVIFNVRNANLEARNEWILEKSDDGKNWSEVQASKSIGEAVENYWILMTYEAESVNAQYIRIRFPHGIFNWYSLLDSVTVREHYVPTPLFEMNDSVNPFRGADTCSAKNNAYHYSSNIIVNNDSFLTQDEKVEYFENGVAASGYVAYKINTGDTVAFSVRNANLLDYKWVLEGTTNGIEWTELPCEKSVNSMTLENYWKLVSYRSDNVNYQYIRIKFPEGVKDWQALLDCVIIDLSPSSKVITNSDATVFSKTDYIENSNKLYNYSSNLLFNSDESCVYQDEKSVNYENFQIMPGYIVYKIESGSYLRFISANSNKKTDYIYKIEGSNDGLQWNNIDYETKPEDIVANNYWAKQIFFTSQINYSYVRIIFPEDSSSWKTKIEKVEVSKKPLTAAPTVWDINSNTPEDFGNIKPDVNAKALSGIDNLGSSSKIFKTGPSLTRDTGTLYMSGKINEFKADDIGYVTYKVSEGSNIEVITQMADMAQTTDYEFVFETSSDAVSWKTVNYSKSIGKETDKFWQEIIYQLEGTSDGYLRIRLPHNQIAWKIRLTGIKITGGTTTEDALSGEISFNNLSDVRQMSNNITSFVDFLGGVSASNEVTASSYVVYKVTKGNMLCIRTEDGDNIRNSDWKIFTSDDGKNWTKSAVTEERDNEKDIIENYWVYTNRFVNSLEGEYVKIIFPSTGWEGKNMLNTVICSPSRENIDLLLSGGYVSSAKAPVEIIRKTLSSNATSLNLKILIVVLAACVAIAGCTVFIAIRKKQTKKRRNTK